MGERTARCPDCGRTLGGGHCRGGKYSGCCRSFTGQAAFDAHRVGPHHPDGQRRCLTVEEMVERGWRESETGWTPRALLTEDERAQLRALRAPLCPEDE